MSTTATAAVTAATFVALFAGHHLGDHIVQTNADAAAKGAPTADRLSAGVHPWTGWPACLRHVATYTLIQALALVLVSVVAPVSWHGAVAALAASASTHAVIDRRWVVRSLIRAKQCQDWREAPYLIDQSLHIGALLVAAVLAAVTTTVSTVAIVVAGAIGIVGVGLAVERRLADDRLAGRNSAGHARRRGPGRADRTRRGAEVRPRGDAGPRRVA